MADVKNISNGIRDVNSKLEGMNGTAGKVMGSLKKMALAGIGLVAANGVKDFFVDAIAAGRETNKVMAQTNAVVKSTGGVAGVSAKDVDGLADKLSKLTGIDDEAIASGENLLLTFTNIRNSANNKMFDRATAGALDYSAATGVSVPAANKLLGKAMNDPIKGLSQLTRVGITFTKQQEDQIKTMVKHGDVQGAQGVIMDQWEKKFGGSAAAQATAWDKLKVQLGNIQESIGQKLIPLLDKLADYIGKNLPSWLDTASRAFDTMKAAVSAVWTVLGPVLGFIADHATVFATLAGIILTVVAAFKVWTAVTKAYTAVQAALNVVMAMNPIGLVVIAIAALVAAIIIAWKNSETFRDIVLGVWSALKSAAIATFNFIKTFITAAWNAIKAVTSAVWNAIKAAVSAVLNAIKTVITTYFNAYKAVITTAIGVIKSVFTTGFNALKGIVTTAFNAVKGAISAAIGGIKSAVTAIINAIKGVFKGTNFASLGSDLIRGFIGGIRAMASRAGDAAKEVAQAAVNKVKSILHIGSPSKLFRQFGKWTVEGLAIGLEGTQKVKSAAAGMAQDVANSFGSPVLSAATVGAGGSSAGNTYNITVNSLDPRTAERLVVDAINGYERKNGGRRL